MSFRPSNYQCAAGIQPCPLFILIRIGKDFLYLQSSFGFSFSLRSSWLKHQNGILCHAVYERWNQIKIKIKTKTNTLIGRIDYIGQRDQLNRMTELLRTNPFIQPNSVNFWYDDFQNWLNRTRQGNAHGQLKANFLQSASQSILDSLSLSPRLETKHITNQPTNQTNGKPQNRWEKKINK